MSISDLYASGTHEENKSHFANIVRLAIMDHVIKKGEQKLMNRLAKSLGLSKEEYKDMMGQFFQAFDIELECRR